MRATWLIAALLLGSQGARADEIALDARLDVAHRALSGTERVELVNDGNAPLDRVYLWLYPNHLATRAPALDDVNFYWVYPTRFEPGFMRVSAVRVDGKPAVAQLRDSAHGGRETLAEIALAQPLPPGGHVVVELTFQTAIPERFGPFGCTDGGCTLLGGFYPMPAARSPSGWDLEGPPARARIRGRLAVDRGETVVAGRRSLSLDLDGEPHVPVIVAPALHAVTREHGGVKLTLYAASPSPPAADANGQVVPYTAEDYPAMILDATERALDVLAAADAPVAPGTELTLVAAPLRTELASAQPGMIVVSNRLYEVLPVEKARKFHERELVRAVFTWALSARDRALPERDRELAAEAGATYLTDIYTARAWRRDESGQDVLSPVGFVPEIDQLIYAPQVAFADAYFGAVADPDKLRDDVRRFASLQPRGSLIYAKLRDRLSTDDLGKAMRGLIVERKSVAAAADMLDAAFFRQWAGAYPPVDYRLGPRRDFRTATGWHHEITVEKITPAGAEAPVEPVTVLVVDDDGKDHELVWDGHGARGVLTLDTAAESLRSIEIDPHGRLVETLPPEFNDSDDLRFDDRTPPRWKLLYSGLGVDLNLSVPSVSLLLDFTLRRVHDVHNGIRLQLYADQATTIGAAGSYSYDFGPTVTPARLGASVGFGVTLSRLASGYAANPSAGTRVSLSAAVGFDDRQFIFEPHHGKGFSVGSRVTLTRFDVSDSNLANVSFFADATSITTPIDGHTIVANLDAAIVAGDLDTRSELIAGGGDLRGYGPTELFGRARLIGHLEWRGSLRHDLDWNFGTYFYLRGIGAAAFVDAGGVSTCGAYGDVLDSDNLFASVGFGLRFFYDDVGVQPAMMALDVAAPLVVHPRSCLGTADIQVAGRPPVMVYLTFLPPF